MVVGPVWSAAAEPQTSVSSADAKTGGFRSGLSRTKSIRSAIAGRGGWGWRTASGDVRSMVAGTAPEIVSNFHPNITNECPLFLGGKRVEKSLALGFLFLMGDVNPELRVGPSLGRCFRPRCLG